jgi:hypothetical protein
MCALYRKLYKCDIFTCFYTIHKIVCLFFVMCDIVFKGVCKLILFAVCVLLQQFTLSFEYLLYERTIVQTYRMHVCSRSIWFMFVKSCTHFCSTSAQNAAAASWNTNPFCFSYQFHLIFYISIRCHRLLGCRKSMAYGNTHTFLWYVFALCCIAAVELLSILCAVETHAHLDI